MSHYADRIQGLCEMGRPLFFSAADLHQLLCAVNLMRNNIPNYSELVQALHDLLERAMEAVESRIKRKLVQVRLNEHGWDVQQDQSFQFIKDALCAMVPMAHSRENWEVCFYTDASQDHWGAIVTQMGPGELEKPLS